MRSLIGGMMAMHAVSLAISPVADVQRPERRKRPSFEPDFIPNDHGPVIDTTPESKRARRRRLARNGGDHAE